MKSRYILPLITSSILLMSGCGDTKTNTISQAENTTQNKDKVDGQTVVNNVVNSTPVATFDTFAINKNTQYNGQLTSRDADADVVEYTIEQNCKNGTITIDKNGCFTYIPDAGYEGKDSFSYTVKDELSSCPAKRVAIDVTQAPILTPAAPTNLRLEALSTCKIKVSWDDNANNETGFEIYQDGKLVSVVHANIVTTDICGGMEPATEYRIAVAAKNIAGASVPVIEHVTTKDITTPPKAPSGLKVSAIDKTSARLVWEDNAWSESAYDIYVNGRWVKVIDANSNCTVVTGLVAGTEYTFQVTAKNKIGGSPSKVITAVTESEPIIDFTAPVLTLLGESPVVLLEGDVYTDEGATAVDDIDGDITSEIAVVSTVDTSSEGNYTVTYTVVDDAGNSASLVREVNVLPLPVDELPTVTIIGSDVVLIIGDAYTDAGAIALDVEDGVLTPVSTSTVDTSTAGNCTVTYTAIDSAGQSVSKTRNVKVVTSASLKTKTNIPYDANLELGGEEGILYYVDPRPEEHGLNRALRIDYLNWSYTDINVSGVNPHSLDRAGDSDKFYVRTQISNSFDVVNFKENTVKTVDMGEHKPRAIGATNLKHKLQLISVRNRQVIDVIDTTTDTIIASLGSEVETPGITTGHALWFDEDHFGLVDRAAPQVVIYKVVDKGGVFDFVETDRVALPTSLHAIERVEKAKTRADLVTFYGNGEGDIAKGGTIVPSVIEFTFDPVAGKLSIKRSVNLVESTAVVNGRPPISHHSGISPDGKYFYTPVFDGHVYIIERATMKVVKVLDAALGAAHVEFSASLGLAVITNHWSNEVTIIDLATQTVKKRIIISTTQEFHPEEPHLLQPHFSYLSKDGKIFYTFATQDGKFLEINLETFTVDRELITGGSPEQAHS